MPTEVEHKETSWHFEGAAESARELIFKITPEGDDVGISPSTPGLFAARAAAIAEVGS